MFNKDKRSLLLSFILGDGNLHISTTRSKSSTYTTGRLTVDHGIAQADYVSWKASMISTITGRNVKMRQGHKGQSVQFAVSFKKFQAWKKFTYPNGKKSISRVLKYIRHPEFAIAIWLMDDGYVEPSISKLATGEKKNYGARFRIFTNDQPIEDHQYFIKWFQDNLGVTPMIKQHRKGDKVYPLLKLNQSDSLIIWEKIRERVLQFKSMQYKFRYIEQIYQFKLLQRNPVLQKTDDIVQRNDKS